MTAELGLDTVGGRLKHARLEAGLSQRQLVEGTPYSAAYVSRLEAGDRTASVTCIRALAVRCGVSAVWLETGQMPTELDREAVLLEVTALRRSLAERQARAASLSSDLAELHGRALELERTLSAPSEPTSSVPADNDGGDPS